jgi:hypothetical protein
MTLMHDRAPSRETTCDSTAPRPVMGTVQAQIDDALQRARTQRREREPIDPILLGALIVLATVAAGLLVGGLWNFAAAHPIAIAAPYFVT